MAGGPPPPWALFERGHLLETPSPAIVTVEALGAGASAYESWRDIAQPVTVYRSCSWTLRRQEAAQADAPSSQGITLRRHQQTQPRLSL